MVRTVLGWAVVGNVLFLKCEEGAVILPIVTMEELAADTLNWFEDGQLMIGSKSNPDHVAAKRRWEEALDGA